MRRHCIFILAGALIGASAASATPAALQQFAQVVERPSELVSFEGKGSPHLDFRLVKVSEAFREAGSQAAIDLAHEYGMPVAGNGSLRVTIHQGFAQPQPPVPGAAGNSQDAAEEAVLEVIAQAIDARVRRLGGTVRGRSGNLVEADIPLAGVAGLAEPGGLYEWVEPSAVAVPMQTVSQGVQVVRADELQSSEVSYGQPGDAVRVGILDSGFLGYNILLGTELPSSVTVRSFHPGGITAIGSGLGGRLHGTAVAEVVHDMAPDAQLFLANVNTPIDHANAVSWLLDQDVDVISNSLAWFNTGPGDGRGTINDDVRRALSADAQWVVSAGNYAQRHWQGAFNDPDGDGFHNFAPGDASNAIFLQAGESIRAHLNWNDWFQSNQNYDFAVVAPNGAIQTSENVQTGFQRPVESLGFTAPVTGFYHFFIFRTSATGTENLEIFFTSGSNLQYPVARGSITVPADTDGAIAVGATFWASDLLESFSSQGPTADGRPKPDISAPDGVDSIALGMFSGTSASAPHVAGAIALMKSRFRIFTFDQIVSILLARADPKGGPNQYGAGRLDVIGR